MSINPHPPDNCIRAMYNLDGRCFGRTAAPLVHASPVICQHCGQRYFHGIEVSSSKKHGGSGKNTTRRYSTTDDSSNWWEQCIHRPLQIQLDNDFALSMLSERDDALAHSAQLVADVGYLCAFNHTYYSLTLSLAKGASLSFEEYVEAANRKSRIRRGVATAAEEEAAFVEELRTGRHGNIDGETLSNMAFEATVNGVAARYGVVNSRRSAVSDILFVNSRRSAVSDILFYSNRF